MKKVLSEVYMLYEEQLDNSVINFDSQGENFGNQQRNSLKLFIIDGKTINVKSFKVPNIFNQIAYHFFRKSKAQRSFEYANKLTELGIGTPQPVAYYEFPSLLLFKKSYYVSEQQDCDLTYRELSKDFNIPNHEAILRAFTRFTFELHEKGINFLDHSPGNTLIKINGNDYNFYLVDLNRMEFKPMDFEMRMKNFARLTVHQSMVEVMSEEYAKLYGKPYGEVFSRMWQYTVDFQKQHKNKRKLKKRLKFWKH